MNCYKVTIHDNDVGGEIDHKLYTDINGVVEFIGEVIDSVCELQDIDEEKEYDSLQRRSRSIINNIKNFDWVLGFCILTIKLPGDHRRLIIEYVNDKECENE